MKKISTSSIFRLLSISAFLLLMVVKSYAQCNLTTNNINNVTNVGAAPIDNCSFPGGAINAKGNAFLYTGLIPGNSYSVGNCLAIGGLNGGNGAGIGTTITVYDNATLTMIPGAFASSAGTGVGDGVCVTFTCPVGVTSIRILVHDNLCSNITTNSPGNTIRLKCLSCPSPSPAVSNLSCVIYGLPANSSTNVSTNPSLSWTALGTNTSTLYDIYLDNANGTTLYQSNISAAAFTIPISTPLLCGTTYTWRVIPKNCFGQPTTPITNCPSSSFTTMGSAPVVCPTISAPANGAIGITLNPTVTWSNVSGATMYDLYLDNVNGSTLFQGNILASATATTSIALFSSVSPSQYFTPALSCNTTYYWRVVAKNNCGVTTCSMTNSFTTVNAVPVCAAITAPLNAATTQSTTPTLSWAASTNATKYDIYLDNLSGAAAATTLFRADWNGITYTIPLASQLLCGTLYSWRVVAKNDCGASTACTVNTFSTAAVAPACPVMTSPANAATGVSLTPSLTWTASTGATSYDIYLDNGTGTTLFEGNFLGSATSYNVPAARALCAGGTYTWKVIAKNACGASTACSSFSFTTVSNTLGCAVLTAPANNAVAQSLTPTLTWTAPTGATAIYYDIYLDNATGTTLYATNLPPTSATSYTVSASTPLNCNTTYTWKVVARNACGASTGCSTFTFTTLSTAPTVCPTLSVPANATNVYTKTPVLTWTAAANATAYDVYLGIGTPVLVATVPGNILSYTIPQASALTCGSAYSWRIVPKNACGSATTCTTSNTFTVNTPIATCPTLTPANAATAISTTPLLSWTAVAGAELYDIYLDNATGTTLFKANIPAAQISYNVLPSEQLLCNTLYSWRVIAKNQCGPVASCPAITFTTVNATAACATLTAPANNATAQSMTPTFTWTAPATPNLPVSYDLYLDAGLGGTTFAANIGILPGSAAPQLSYAWPTNNPLLCNTVYTWRIVPRFCGNVQQAVTACPTTFTFTTVSPAVATVTSTIPVAGLCGSSKVTMTATGATPQPGVTYQWLESASPSGPFVPSTSGYGMNTTVYQPALTTSTIYYQFKTTANNPGTCSPAISATYTVAVGAAPTAPIATNSIQCGPGIPTASVTSTAGASGTGQMYWYSAPTGGTLVQGPPVSGPGYNTYLSSISTTQNYFVSENSVNGCPSPRTQVTASVGQLPILNTTQTPSGIQCYGVPITLHATGASTYVWNGNATSVVGDTTFSNGPPGTYTVTGTDAIGCSSTKTITVALHPLVVNTTTNASPAAFCIGNSTSLTGSSAPICGGSLTTFAGIYAPANWVFSLTNSNGTVNTGSAPASITMTSGTNNNSLSNPGTTNYAMTFGCAGTVSFNWSYSTPDLPPFDYPQYTINGGAPVVFPGFNLGGATVQSGTASISVPAGGTLTLQAYTADNDLTPCTITISNFSGPNAPISSSVSIWTAATGGTNLGTPPLTVTPTTSGNITYYASFTASNTGCTNPTRVPIPLTVNALPTVTSSPAAPNVCAGSSLILNGGGANSYSWTGGISDNTSFIPSGTATYTVTGVDANSCSNSTTVLVTVNALPTVTATPSTSTACENSNVTLVGGGASTYSWTGGITDNTAFPATTTTTYTVTGTDANLCSATATAVLNVNPAPSLSVLPSSSVSVCDGLSTMLSGNGANTYSWTGGISDATAFTPTATTTYTVTGTNTGTGCTTTTTATVTVNPIPTLGTTNANPSTVCFGIPTVLSYSDAAQITNWYTAASAGTNVGTGTTLNLTPSTSGSLNYYAEVSDAVTGCVNTNRVATPVTVNALPTVTATPVAQSICQNNMANIAGGGATSYSWTGGISDNTPFSVIGSNTYTVTGTDGNNCQNTATAVVTMNALPNVNASATPSSLCINSLAVLNGSGATTYSWTGGATDNTPFVATAINTYTVIGTDANSCTATSTVTVNVNAASGILALASSGNSSSNTGNSNQSQTQPDGTSVDYYDASCNLISNVNDGSGGNILGNTVSNVTVDATVNNYNGQPYVRRWYQITPTNNGPATITLYLTQDDFDDYNAANGAFPDLPTSGSNSDPNISAIRVSKVDGILGSGTPTVITPTAVNWNGNYWEITFPVASFSQFYFHAANPLNSALPVNITSFTGEKSATSDLLNWNTSSEQNNAYFNLQHSTDGIHFTLLDKVNTKAIHGNSNSPLQYAYEHKVPTLGHNYYRLEQVDIDGKASIHQKIVDLIWAANGSTVSIYPNPTQDVLQIDLYTVKEQNTTIKIMDMSGRIIKQVQAKSIKGLNNLSISLGEFTNGVYTVQIFENNQLTQVSKVNKN